MTVHRELFRKGAHSFQYLVAVSVCCSVTCDSGRLTDQGGIAARGSDHSLSGERERLWSQAAARELPQRGPQDPSQPCLTQLTRVRSSFHTPALDRKDRLIAQGKEQISPGLCTEKEGKRGKKQGKKAQGWHRFQPECHPCPTFMHQHQPPSRHIPPTCTGRGLTMAGSRFHPEDSGDLGSSLWRSPRRGETQRLPQQG